MAPPLSVVGDIDPRSQFTADGIQTTFVCAWVLRSLDELRLIIGEADEVESVYSVTGVNDDAGFAIVFDQAPAEGTVITAYREGALARSANYGQETQFSARAVNAQEINTLLRLQEMRSAQRRGVTRALTDPATGQLRMPLPVAGQYLRWDESGNLVSSTVEPPDVTPPDSHVTTKYLDDIPEIDWTVGADNGPLLAEFFGDLTADGGGKLVGDSRAVSLLTSVGVPSFVTVEALKMQLGPTATFGIAGRKKVAFTLGLLSDADASDMTLHLDTSAAGGGAVSDYAYVGMPFSISGGGVQESNAITAIDDGARTATLATALTYGYAAATATVALEVSALLAANNTLLSDQVTVDAAHIARLSPLDFLALEDDRRTGGATTWMEIRQALGIEDAGDNIISLSGQTRRQYLASQRARLTVYEMARRAAIVGCSVECIGTAVADRYDPLFEIRYALDSVIEDCEYAGTDSVGRRGNMFRIHKSAACHLIRPTGRNPLYTNEGEGNGAVIAYSTRCSIQDPVFQSCRHGVQMIAATESWCSNPDISDSLLTALDFHGMNSVGCWYSDVHNIAFASRTASASNGVLAIGNATWQDGDHECGIIGGSLGPFQGNSGVYGIRAFPPSTKPMIRDVHGVNMESLIIHRDISGAGTLKVTDLEIIDCSTQGCADRVIDLQGRAAGASVDTLERCRISNFRGAGLYRGILAYDVTGLTIEDSRLEFQDADATSERYALAAKRITGLHVADTKTYGSNRGLDLEDCPAARLLKVDLIGLGDDLILKDRGGNSGTEFRGCNAYLVDGSDATGIDNSGGSSILYKAVGNIGVETTEAAEFSATDKLFARISSGGGPAEEADFSNAAQALCAAASAIAQVDLLFGVGSNIASASTTDLSTATEAAVTVTGTTTITSFGTVTRGIRFVRFAASLTLTHHATALILPGAANIQTEAGDTAFMYSLGSGNWVCMAYVRGAGSLATQRSNAVDITGGTIAGITDLAVSDGGTGSSTSRGALDNLFVQGADVASATTTNLASVTGQFVNITGTTTITGFGTTTAGRFRWLRFAAALTLTHNGTSLILPGAANITTAAGDTCLAMSLGSGNWMVPSYQRADGTAVVVTPVSRGGTGAATKALARVALGGGAAALSDGATIATDCSANDTFAVTLGGNRTLGNPTNVVADTWYTWVLKQDGTGSRTLALDTNFVQADGDSFAMKTAANSTTMLVAYAETTSRLLVSAKKYA